MKLDEVMKTITIVIPKLAQIELCWPLTNEKWERIDNILRAYRSLSEDTLMPDDREILSQEIMKSTMDG